VFEEQVVAAPTIAAKESDASCSTLCGRSPAHQLVVVEMTMTMHCRYISVPTVVTLRGNWVTGSNLQYGKKRLLLVRMVPSL
jgi:hypothetical protein